MFACYGFITYLFKLLIPHHLSAFYPYPVQGGAGLPGWYYIYPVILAGLVALVFYSFRYTRKIFFALSFFAITVFLVLQLLPVGGAIMADRYTYIPSIGFFYLAGEGFYWLWQKKSSTINLKYFSLFMLSIVAILISVITYQRCKVWESSMTLWNDVISKEKKVALAYNNRGAIWQEQKKYPEALEDYNKAVGLRPKWAEPFQNRGVLFAIQGRYPEAISDYNKAIELKPEFTEAYNNRGMLLMNTQKYAEAKADFDKAIALQPGFATGYNNRGNLFLNMEKYDEAMADYTKAVALEPGYFKAYNGMGVLLMRQKKYDEAITKFNKAIETQPGYGEAFSNRAISEYYSGKKDIACKDLQEAIRLGFQNANDLYSQWCR